MAHNSNPPNAESGGLGASAFAGGNAGTKANIPDQRPHPVIIKSLTAIPDAPAFVMVTLVGCEPIKVRVSKLRSVKRFRNAVKYRLGVDLASVSQDTWAAMVEQLVDAAMEGCA